MLKFTTATAAVLVFLTVIFLIKHNNLYADQPTTQLSEYVVDPINGPTIIAAEDNTPTEEIFPLGPLGPLGGGGGSNPVEEEMPQMEEVVPPPMNDTWKRGEEEAWEPGSKWGGRERNDKWLARLLSMGRGRLMGHPSFSGVKSKA